MVNLESILRVLVVGLILGAGLPALFACGLVAYSSGAGTPDADGVTRAPNPALKYLGVALFTIVAAVILVGLLWITRSTIEHQFGLDLFPFAK
ncbi:hypothetical protein [Mycolicibacterium monacense]|uniref:Transmembrane protein n=4 Tax=Mycobacteriaceae TaxID=1762 RepID=A0AAD1N0F8_MYCMB|nr:hypothetical protein [Mycolicibacterium monacense]MDA4100278.1 hypothetical protein [Mycolicibacterium monacense DSM 44395]OBF48689.1 hypothetical protein A5778_21895 [Mycolicibacterium monacense]ORB22411.1 hypothetical protein BST34_07130 [Mycolicibacterium monacense DSM 44395]QHP84569.1 hypothetical protein EWR22_03820 [Mycolicibacterium monacense DSM 44395]BBZ62664.1 hypothetical protein MMON_39650 [Mycolicibacterium monacense]